VDLSSFSIGVPVKPMNEAFGKASTHVFCVPVFNLSIGVNVAYEAILAPMRFISNHYNIRTFREFFK
jgi:hypothetical protein